MKKNVYLALTVFGIIIPYYFIFRFFTGHDGNALAAMFALFNSNMSAAFTADLLFAILVFWVFVSAESNRIGLKNWWLFALAAIVGLSFALPLYLYFRERQMDSRT